MCAVCRGSDYWGEGGMMSRKDYIAFAEAIREISDLKQREAFALLAARIFAADNSAFRKSTFLAACGVLD